MESYHDGYKVGFWSGAQFGAVTVGIALVIITLIVHYLK